MIGIKNNGSDIIKGRYDGKDYEFKPGVTVALSDEAARHIFGYGEDDKTRSLIRLGWLANSTHYDQAASRLDSIQFFAEAKVTFEEPEAPTQLPTPTPAPGFSIPEFAKSGKK
jgi:hypothetical protein